MLPSIIYFLIPATIALHLPPGYHAGLLQRAEDKAPAPSDTITSCTFRYTTESSEDYDYVEEYWGVSHKDFVAWNPSVQNDCSGIKSGTSYCVEVNEGTPSLSSVSETATNTPTATRTPGPSPTLNGTVAGCNRWHHVKKGDTCDTITKDGLWANYYFCVSIPEHKTATTSASTASLARPTGPYPSAPTQEGITKDCTTWHIAKKGESCDKVIAQYGNLDIATFVGWNPAVEDDCSGLWSGYAYCVGTKTNPKKRPVPTSTKENPVATENPTPTGCETTHPSPTQPGTICDCTKWHKVTGTDSCWNLIKRYKITEKQFDVWNPKAVCVLWKDYNVCVEA
ncbi:hypothetical protein NCS52_01117000 [Fusarium sp. LHS14.1]|nr:hypothetical protein NCS52_01117000 [Fusarium sp. LHS14.1]